jgi:hypothetical protein
MEERTILVQGWQEANSVFGGKFTTLGYPTNNQQ